MAFQAVYISEIGSQQNPFTYAVTDSSGNLIEERWDHGLSNVITATAIRVSRKAPDKQKFERVMEASKLDIDLYVTDSRVALSCKKYKKGGGWYGTGIGGMVAALAIDAGSKIIAAATSKGKILLGQIRYEWIYFLGYSHRTGMSGHNAVQICYRDSQKNIWLIVLLLKNNADAAFLTNDILHRASKYRLEMTNEKSPEALEFFNKYSAGSEITPNADPKGSSVITFPHYYFAPNGEDKRPPVSGWRCAQCGTTNTEDAMFCGECGSKRIFS
ncbi:MAG: zinc ribbon domain-containing protein [Sporolactobacillus sp.]